ncbi:MAG: oligosaccharide flippase family protein [Candidatus Bathyarchaeota archaeon]|nr:oligosaccharide flippase family protein [Candidatus Bathyarchaeota archaeon]
MTEDISPQTHVARGATFIFVQGFLNAALGVLYVWFLLHTKEIAGQILFTEADFGMYTMLSFILTLTSTLGIFALRSASVRYIAHYLAKGEKDEARSVVTRVLQVSVVTSLTIAVLIFVLAGVLSNIFGISVLIFQLLPLSSFIQIFYFQTQGFLQGLQKIREIAIIGIFYTVVQYSVATLLVYAGFGILGIVIGWVFALVLSCSTSFFIAFRNISPSAHAHKLKPLLVFSFPIYVSALLVFIVGWVDQILVFPFLGTEALGVYSIAVRASVVSNLVSVAITVALFPKLSEMHSMLGVDSLKDAFKTSTRYAALLGFPISLMVATLAYPIIVLFATVRYVGAVLPLAVMCIASLPAVLGSAIFPTLYTLKRTKVASSITAIVIVLEAFLSYVSLAYLNADLTGVALSRFFAALAGFSLGAYVLWSSLKIDFDKEAIWKSATASITMVLSLFSLELLRAIIDPLSYQFLVLRLRLLPVYAVVGVVVHLLSLIALKAMKKRDIELLHDYLPSRLRWIADLFSRIARVKEV